MDCVWCLRVLKPYAQLYRKRLEARGSLDLKYCMQKHPDGTVTLPILASCVTQLDLRNLQATVAPGSTCEIVQVEASQQPRKKRAKSKTDELGKVLKELLSIHGENWGEELGNDIPHRWQCHGDLVLLREDCFCLPVWKKLGAEVWLAVARVLGARRVAQVGRVSQEGFRTPVVTMLLGEDSWVSHVDNMIRYEFDITKCMFSSGNITEKLRVASFNCDGETIVDLYAGIGYFTLPYLVHTGASHVHACEWNPEAVKALRRNLEINAVSHRCTVHQGDNRQLPLYDLADRVNLGLLPSSRDGWPVACRLLRRGTGGVLHIHQNVPSPTRHAAFTAPPLAASDTSPVDQKGGGPEASPRERVNDRDVWLAWAEDTASHIASLLCDITGGPWRTSIQHIECVKSYAPHIHHIVLDLECRPFKV